LANSVERPHRVLVGDDVEDVRRTLISYIQAAPDLELAGEAASGLELVDVYKALRPDIVSTDINKPDINGIEATVRIKSFDANAHIVIVSAVAYDSDYMRLAMAAGVSDMLAKPVGHLQYTEALRMCLSRPAPLLNRANYDKTVRAIAEKEARRAMADLRQSDADWEWLLHETTWEALRAEYRETTPGLIFGDQDEWREKFDSLSHFDEFLRVKAWATSRYTDEWERETPIQRILRTHHR